MKYAQVALDVPLRTHFDYLPPADTKTAELLPGMRVEVPFCERSRVGVLLELSENSTVPIDKLRHISRILDTAPLLDSAHLKLLKWASNYYHHALGEVIFQALPAATKRPGYQLRQLPAAPDTPLTTKGTRFQLNAEQKLAVTTIEQRADGFSAFLLDGVTGSGKTEVYLRVIEQLCAHGGQSLVLLPEIALTPQMLERFQAYFSIEILAFHSGLSPKQRLVVWEHSRSGQARIIIGTRSAIWLPLAKPGLYIVDEEHDTSYKQQDGLLYSARDMALARAKQDGVPILLGSATPSLESLHNAKIKKYHHLSLTQRAGAAKPATVSLLDLRTQAMNGVFSHQLLEQMKKELEFGNQVLLIKNRRGYATRVVCHNCDHTFSCPRCNYSYTFHKEKNCLLCHRCNSHRKIPTGCPQCGQSALDHVGHGTERITQALAKIFPEQKVLRFDSDTANSTAKLRAMIQKISDHESDIIVGTQMLAKGHHFPNITLVGVLDADFGLYGTDYRAEERLAQLLVQVSGRSGRGLKPGKILIQTNHPGHPVLRTLLLSGYANASRALYQQRKLAHLPPLSYHALLRGRAKDQNKLERFMKEAFKQLSGLQQRNIDSFGPLTPQIEKHSGYYRRHILIQAEKRRNLHLALDDWLGCLDSMKKPSGLFLSIDIDPQEML